MVSECYKCGEEVEDYQISDDVCLCRECIGKEVKKVGELK